MPVHVVHGRKPGPVLLVSAAIHGTSMARHGWLLVWGAVVIFAASSAVARLLHDIGLANPMDGRNPISFCNVLFVGNLCAALTLLAFYRRSWTMQALRGLSRGDWISLAIVAPLSSALAPALIFLGNLTIFAFMDLDNWMMIGALMMTIGSLPISLPRLTVGKRLYEHPASLQA